MESNDEEFNAVGTEFTARRSRGFRGGAETATASTRATRYAVFIYSGSPHSSFQGNSVFNASCTNSHPINSLGTRKVADKSILRDRGKSFGGMRIFPPIVALGQDIGDRHGRAERQNSHQLGIDEIWEIGIRKPPENELRSQK